MVTKQEINYFKILGLDDKASKEDIKRAYKKLAKQFHPDLHIGDQEKALAEKQFKVIKKAYDLIMENFEKEQSLMSDVPFNDLDFLKFFADKNCNLKFQTENNQSQKIAIKFMEEQIQKFNIDMRFVFKCIETEKMFILWDVNKKEELKKILSKEVAYREYIKKSSLYLAYIQNKIFFNKPDIALKIKINPKYQNNFEEKISFDIYKICNCCLGKGCEKCHKGITNIKMSRIIKFGHIKNNSHYKIKNAGNKLDIVNGDLLIHFILDVKTPKWSIKQKSNYELLDQISELYKSSKKLALNYHSFIRDFVINYKIHVIYSSIIVILLILFIVICAIFI